MIGRIRPPDHDPHGFVRRAVRPGRAVGDKLGRGYDPPNWPQREIDELGGHRAFVAPASRGGRGREKT